MRALYLSVMTLVLVLTGCGAPGSPTAPPSQSTGRAPTTAPVGAPLPTVPMPPTQALSSKVRCSPMPVDTRTTIDWVDFVRFGGITYVDPGDWGRPLAERDLGPVYGTVQLTYSGTVTNPYYAPTHAADGDAAFLARGTPVYTLKGYAPRFRLAACLDHRLVLYQADTVPNARTGADLFDIKNKVSYIGIVDHEDGRMQLGAIRDPATVQQLVGMILDAPVKPELDAQPGAGPWYSLVLHLTDGTTVREEYDLGSGSFGRGVELPAAFVDAVRAAIGHTTGTPRPQGSAPPDFELVFDAGPCGIGRLDTFRNTFTKNMIVAPDVTILFRLPRAGLDSIYRKMTEIAFFDYPARFAVQVPRGAEREMVTPANSYYFRVRSGGRTKELRWTDDIVRPTNRQADNLRELITLIERTISSRPEYQKLPQPRGGCA